MRIAETKCKVSRTNALMVTSACCALVAATPIHAQIAADPAVAPETPAPDATSPGPAVTEQGGLQEIVVTAQKKAENLQRVPISVTALDNTFLETRNISDPGQLNGLVPGVSIQPSFILLTYIRGLGNYSSQPGVDQSVAYNYDDIYISKPYGMPPIIFDIDRVELLRGPQGTLQGRNAVAGAINFVTAKPKQEFGAKITAAYGNYDAVRLEGMVNVPLADGYAFRIAGASAEHDGYFRNGYGDQNVIGLRASFLAEPSPDLTAVITAEYSKRDELGATYSPCPPGSTAAQGCAGVRWDPWAGTPGQGTDATLNQDEPNLLYSKNKAIYAHVDYDVGIGTITWVPNYREWKYRNHQSLSSAFGYAPAVNDRMHSQELRMGSNAGSPVNWVFGLYYGKESAEEQNYFTAQNVPNVTISRPGFRTIGNVYFKNDITDYTYKSTSLFGQATVPIVDGFRISGGLRYTRDRKRQAGNTGIVLLDPVTNLPVVVSVDVSGGLKTNKLNYKVGVEFDVAPQVMIYGNVSDGYKAGGVNGVPPTSDFPPTFGPEEITAYQAGIKSRFFDSKVQLNAEGFYYNYRGYQTSGFDVTDTGVLIGGTFNSQKARLYGGEVEASFAISRSDLLSLNATVLSAIYTKFEVPETGAFLTGQRLQNAPKFTATIDYTHTFDLANGGDIVAHAQTRHESAQYVDYRQTPGSLTGGRWRSLADLTYNEPNDRWSIAAFIDNITNDDALLVSNAGLGPFNLGQPYPPRTYGVRVTGKF